MRGLLDGIRGALGPDAGLKMTAIGDSLVSLGAGVPMQSPAYQALLERQQRAAQSRQLQESGILERFTPEQQAILAQMPPSAAQQIIAQTLFAPEPQGPAPTDDMREYDFARSQGYEGTFQDFMLDMRRAGASTVDVSVGGEQPGAVPLGTSGQILVPDASVPGGYRVINAPGSQADLERVQAMTALANEAIKRAEGAEAETKGDAQERIRMGTTLRSLHLNIEEIEDGGLPVTGPIGAARRTALGAMLTGTDAIDVQNRTNQITDAAALEEIQRMKERGQGVGQLTEGERVAIGNAVTALNTATSQEEYLRAAKEYRQIALDISLGEGNWELDPDTGDVLFSPDGDAAPSERDSFLNDPAVKRAAEQAGVTPEEMWEIRESLGQ